MSTSSSFSSWTRFFNDVSRFLEGAEHQYGIANYDFCDYVLGRLELCVTACTQVEEQIANPSSTSVVDDEDRQIIEEYHSNVTGLVECLIHIYKKWLDYMDMLDIQSTRFRYQTEVIVSGTGRPRFHIEKEQLEYLSSLNFTWTEIASLLGVSRMTIYRRRAEFEMLDDSWRMLSDVQLNSLVKEMHAESPAMGVSMVIGKLRMLGYHVSRERVRCALRSADPLSVALRWKGVLSRRQPYSVGGPNSLWHIDSHHKLIRWRIVTHGCIDGYSRLITFLKCCGNNNSRTVYELFLKAVQEYHLPSRIRTDQGGENVLVAQHMLEKRGSDRRSAIVGSSVHNQRIERLWRDMHRCVTVVFYKLFYFMEQMDVLDPLNEVQLFALHYIFIPRINQSLSHFKNGWNHHSIRTAQHKSPHQIFTAGALLLQHSGLAALDFFLDVDDNYGLDVEAPPPPEENQVVVPEVSVRLSSQQFGDLKQTINPLASSDDFAIDLYEQTVQYLSTLNIQ